MGDPWGQIETKPPPLKRQCKKQAAEIQLEAAVSKLPGAYGKEHYLVISEPVSKGQDSLRDFSRKKGAVGCHFPPPHPNINTGPPAGPVGCQHWPPQICPFQSCLPKSQHWVPKPRRAPQTLSIPCLMTCALCDSLVLAVVMVAVVWQALSYRRAGSTLLKLCALP